jgi:rhamnosyltransferase
MHHSLGALAERHSLRNLKKTTRSFHPPIRLYYMVRNFFYINALYKEGFKKELKMNKTDLLNRIKNNLLYKKGRMQTLKFIFKGWKDFKQNKMGKICV